MKIKSRKQHRLISIFFALLYVVVVIAYPKTAIAQATGTQQCSEEMLRNQQVAIINCKGSNICETGVTSIGGADNIAKIFNYFLGKGYKDFQIAGMLGNMKHESGIAPQVVQGKPGVVTPVEALTPAQLSDPKLGYGLVQWTPVSKMIDPVRAAGKDPNDLVAQLDFLWEQLEGGTPSPEKRAGDHLKATTNVAEATLSFETKYERHAGAPQPQRIADAEKILNDARANGTTAATTATTSAAAISKVYILGDSITHGAASRYTQAFAAKNITPTVSAVTGRSWNTPGNPGAGATGTTGTGKQAVATDQAAIREAGAIVVALGTNGGLGSNPIEEVVSTLRSANPNAPIYWVNTAASVPPANGIVSSFNSALMSQQSAGKISVVDWAKAVDPSGAGTADPNGLLGDGIHPSANGYEQLTNLVVNAVTTGATRGTETGCAENSSVSSEGFSAKVLAYAWPDYHPRPFVQKKPEYAAAIQKAKSEGRYVGNDGIDCGGFVTTLMIDSGFEPRYNYDGKGGNTSIQKQWLDANWESLGAVTSTDQLQQGDVAWRPGHTFVFVGDIPGFNSQMASASNGERAPMADKYGMNDSGIVWYRKK